VNGDIILQIVPSLKEEEKKIRMNSIQKSEPSRTAVLYTSDRLSEKLDRDIFVEYSRDSSTTIKGRMSSLWDSKFRAIHSKGREETCSENEVRPSSSPAIYHRIFLIILKRRKNYTHS